MQINNFFMFYQFRNRELVELFKICESYLKKKKSCDPDVACHLTAAILTC